MDLKFAKLLKREYIFNPYVAILLFFLWRLPNAQTGLADAYQFRQTQTAWGIREVARNGINFLHLRMPVLGQPYEVPFEFPLFQNIAGFLSQLLDLSPATAGRSVSLFFYCLSLVLFVYLSKELFEKKYFLLFLPLLMFTPFAIEWSNACLIESTATSCILLSLIFINKYLVSSHLAYAINAFIFLSLGALVKITSAVPLSFFLIFFLILNSKNHVFGKRAAISFLISILSLVPAVFWTNHADSIKASNPWAEWLTSRNLTTWNFGSIDGRFDLENWQGIAGRLWIIGGLTFVWTFGYLFWKSRRSIRAWLISLGAFSPIFVFFNLYVVHDYYFLAICPFLFLACAYLCENVEVNKNILSREGAIGAVVLFTVILSWTLHIPQRNYLEILRMPRNSIPELSQTISAVTNTDDEIIVVGCDWDPTVLYHADRYGLAVPGKFGDVRSILNFLETTTDYSNYKYLASCPGTIIPKDLAEVEIVPVATNLFKIYFIDN